MEIAERRDDLDAVGAMPLQPTAYFGRSAGSPNTLVRTAGPRARLSERLTQLWYGLLADLAREAEHGHLFHFVPVFLGAGAVTWFSLARPPPTSVLTGLLAALLFLLLAAATGRPRLRGMLACVVLPVAGMVLAAMETGRLGTTILDSGVTTIVTGIVERREAGANGEWRYEIRLTATAEPRLKRPPERISILARGANRPALLGEAIRGRARLSPPSGPALPGLNDFAFASYFNEIGAVGFFLGPAQAGAAGMASNEGFWIMADRVLFSLRDRISTRIRTELAGDPGAFAASIITGERRSMSKGATEALRLSGLAHITAISGLNMALAAGIFFVGLRKILSLLPGLAQTMPIKKFAAFGALAAAFAYLLISGCQVSAVRAFLMTAIMLVAVLFDRPAISLRNLALAAIVILVVSPSAVMGPSFQMSFAATAGLIAGYAAWRSRPRKPSLPFAIPGLSLLAAGGKILGGAFATSLIGGLSTAAFAVSHFHRLAPHSLEANLVAMPIISILVMPAGLVAMLLMPLGLDGPFLWVMGWGLEWVIAIAEWIAGWDDAIRFSRLPGWFLPLTSLGLLMLTLLRSHLRQAGSLLLGASLLAVLIAPLPPVADLYVAEDGRLVGMWMEPGRLATNRVRPPSFIFDQWQSALGFSGHEPPVFLDKAGDKQPSGQATQKQDGSKAAQDALAPAKARPQLSEADLEDGERRMKAALAKASGPRFACEGKSWCVAVLENGWTIATVEEPVFVGGACDSADIVIAARRTGFQRCQSGAHLFTAETLRQTGALEITLGNRRSRTLSVTSAIERGDNRPWTVHRLYDWRTERFVFPPTQDESAPRSHEKGGFDDPPSLQW
ncbi:ComEC/Rec2 family competence protein [Rhizobium sp. CAU 1783]